ncbi:MAG TPA: ABC transporter permease subunit [Actinomycetes bacterium]|nr:ABC transporter permease subunit [Actinomycetes bacterium]
MIWLTWRQFRVQAVAVYTAVAAVAAIVAITGPRLAELARIDANVFDRLTTADRNLFYAGVVVMAVAPAVVGAFWGAPVVARELEGGTHRLAWNQTVTRTRWLATKLGVTTLAAAAAAGLLTLAVTWWSAPLDGAASMTRGGLPSRLTPVTFAMRGVAPIGYAVFAVALGVAVGIVLRRSLAAVAVTLAVFTFVQIAMPLWVRPHLVAPAQQTIAFTDANFDGIGMSGTSARLRITVTTGNRGDWVLSNETVDATGQVVALPSWVTDCLPPPVGRAAGGTVKATLRDCFARLTDEGYRQRVTYQPADRFWTLQWAETALFLGLSGLLTGFSFWWIRRLA